MNLDYLFMILWFLTGMIFTAFAIYRNYGAISKRHICVIICGGFTGLFAIFNYFVLLNPRFMDGKDE